MPLISLEQAKEYLRLSQNTDDELLTRMIEGYSAAIETFISRRLDSHSVIERRDGTGKDWMLLRDYPATTVQSVIVDGRAVPASSNPFDFASAGYSFDDARILLTGYTFTRGRMNVRVEYTAGYTPELMPADIVEACCRVVGIRYKELAHLDEKARSMAGETTSYETKMFPDQVLVTLNSYRRVAPL